MIPVYLIIVLTDTMTCFSGKRTQKKISGNLLLWQKLNSLMVNIYLCCNYVQREYKSTKIIHSLYTCRLTNASACISCWWIGTVCVVCPCVGKGNMSVISCSYLTVKGRKGQLTSSAKSKQVNHPFPSRVDEKQRITRSSSFSGKTSTRSSTPNSDVTSTRHSARNKRKSDIQAEDSASRRESRRSRQSLPDTGSTKTRTMARNSLDFSKPPAKRKHDQSVQGRVLFCA